jgi:hypothetical protein
MMYILFPFCAQSQIVSLAQDDNVFESSTPLPKPAAPGGQTETPVPSVQFDAPGTGVYALDSVSLHLLQAPVTMPSLDGSPGAPDPGLFTELTPLTYPVTVKIWSRKTASGADWVAEDSLDADLIVTKPGLYVLSMSALELTFTGSIRVAVFLRTDGVVLIPETDVHLGVDTDGLDSTPSKPFGHSYRYIASRLPWGNPWVPALAANYGVRASVHLIPEFNCRGFLPPLDGTITMATGGRTIPLKATLFDDAGLAVMSGSLASPPLVRLLYASDSDVVNPVDATDSVVPAGRSAAGKAFSQDEGTAWSYNLKTGKNLPAGTYTVQMKSGDGMGYLIDPTCVGTFVIENRKQKNREEPIETEKENEKKRENEKEQQTPLNSKGPK